MNILLRPHKLKHYVDVMRGRNISSETVLAGTGLTDKLLTDPGTLVSIDQHQQVICNILDATGNSALGLEIGSSATLADYGELSIAMMSAQDLREAASDWPKLCQLFGMFISYDFREESPGWSINNTNCHGLKNSAQVFALEEFFLIHFRLAEALTGQVVNVDQLSLPYPPPPHAAKYNDYFNCEIKFNSKKHGARIISPSLDTPIRSGDPYLHEFIHRRCAEILRQASHQGAVVPRLRSLFLARPGQLPTQAEAAAYLGMSTRSLRRKLYEEQGSFQEIMDSTRFELAHQYLVTERLSPKQTAYLLGYQNVAAFRKSFKIWSGQTISDYLKSISR